MTSRFNESNELPHDALLSQVTTFSLWFQFRSHTLRQLGSSKSSFHISSLPAVHLRKQFWSITMPLPVRDLWYRVLCDKLPTGVYLHQIGHRPSSNYPLCLSSAEIRSHIFFFFFFF
ncbi:MAG: hypothetical protein EXX96DRAFT_530828 [Benjaminiella poitrasii]|nr:MAG: hypothetical protein EXX96DRAFT_530828 [Benjaminiella poitrasii]